MDTPKLGREAVLKERARRLAAQRTPGDAEAEASRDWLMFSRAGRVFGLETGLAVEAHMLERVTPIPCTPRFILGVTAVRGLIVALMDLLLFLDLEAGPDPESPAMIILSGDGLTTALLADGVLGVERLPEGQVLRAPDNLPPELAPICRGVTRQGWLLLDGRALLADPRLVVEEHV